MMNKPTKLQTAKANLLKVIYCKNNNEEISIENTRERVNYNEVISKINLPSTANSAVDGYGILAETLNENKNIEFQVIGVAKAGHPLNVTIKIKEAVEIYTGAIIPRGIDAVIMHEKCNRIGNKVIIKENVIKNQNIRPIGENLQKREVVIVKGKIINAADIGQLAASGNKIINVYKKIKVSVISTGDELVDTSINILKDGQIYDSNRPMLISLLNANYLKTIDMGIVKDNRKDLALRYEDCLSKSDIVISSGGASDGIEDHTQNALRDIGAKCVVWQLAMKPGKPMAVGIINKKIIFCLPGNPVAAFVCSKLLIKPLVDKLAGGIDLDPFTIKLPSDFEHKKKPGRAEYLRAKIVNKDNSSFITLHGKKGAGVISSLTGADGLVEIPLESENISKGDMLTFIPFDHRGL